jgi:hypothetical protein
MFAGIVEMSEQISHVDVLYVTKNTKNNKQFLNLVRLDRANPETILTEVKNVSVKNVRRIEVLRAEGPEEFFV